jgi:hypothetical protein
LGVGVEVGMGEVVVGEGSAVARCAA